MDQLLSDVAYAVNHGATTIKLVIEATGLSRLKAERALSALEKQKLLIRDAHGYKTPEMPAAPMVAARECGSCAQCCTLMEVTDVGKPANQWCQHCEVDKGCSIYEQRPQMCRSFSCAWLQGHLNDDWFPEKTGLVVHFSQDAVNVQVDPRRPDRWKQEPFFSKLCEWLLNGIKMIGNRGYATLVVVGSAKYLLLGRTIVPEPSLFGTAFLPVGAETFRFWKANSQEHLQRLQERSVEIQQIRQEFGYCAVPDDDDPHPPYRPELLRLSKHEAAESQA